MVSAVYDWHSRTFELVGIMQQLDIASTIMLQLRDEQFFMVIFLARYIEQVI